MMQLAGQIFEIFFPDICDKNTGWKKLGLFWFGGLNNRHFHLRLLLLFNTLVKRDENFVDFKFDKSGFLEMIIFISETCMIKIKLVLIFVVYGFLLGKIHRLHLEGKKGLRGLGGFVFRFTIVKSKKCA